VLGHIVAHPGFPIGCLLIATAFLMPILRRSRKAGLANSATAPSWPCYAGGAGWAALALVDVYGRTQGATLRVDIIVLGPILAVLTLICVTRLAVWKIRNLL
jgi:hypothetical protein